MTRTMARHALPTLVVGLAFTCCDRREETPAKPQELLGLRGVVIAPEGEEELGSPVVLGGEARPALAAATPAEFRYRVAVPERALLTFAIGIAETGPPHALESLPGARMRFVVRAGDAAAADVLFDREIHVSRRDRWLSQLVDLKSYAGEEIWLVFQTSFPGYEGGASLPLAGVFGDPVLHDRAAYASSTGVVVVSIDTLRRDHVSLYGYPRRTTPGLEALARDAVVFDDAVSTASWTLPAHASLFTSTYPGVHGAVSSKVGLSSALPGLAGVLREGGFFTQAMVTHVYLSTEYGFGEGFTRHRYLPETRAEEVTNEAVRFLESKGDTGFFLFIHYYDPHWHYDPPPPYDTVFDPAYGGSASGVWWDFKELDAETISPQDLKHIEALYDGEILYTDRHVERLLQEMKRIGVYEGALIIVTSDHGEEFLEHGRWEHQKTLYEEQLRIPLVIKLPRSEMKSRRVEEQVSLVDVAPTILDVLGIERPETFQGRSLLPAMGRGRALAEGAREAWAETEHTLDGSRKIAVRLGAEAEKAIFTLREGDVMVEIFDLESDSGERRNLDGPGRREAAEKRLHDYLNEAESRRERTGRAPEVDLPPEELERLRALGYVK